MADHLRRDPRRSSCAACCPGHRLSGCFIGPVERDPQFRRLDRAVSVCPADRVSVGPCPRLPGRTAGSGPRHQRQHLAKTEPSRHGGCVRDRDDGRHHALCAVGRGSCPAGPVTQAALDRQRYRVPNVPRHPGPCLPLVLGPGARKVTDRPRPDSHNVGRAFWDKNADDLPGAIKLIHLGRQVSQVVADSLPCKVILSSSRHGMIAVPACGVPAAQAVPSRAAAGRRNQVPQPLCLGRDDVAPARNGEDRLSRLAGGPYQPRDAAPCGFPRHRAPAAECLPVRRARRALCLSPGRGAAALRLAAL